MKEKKLHILFISWCAYHRRSESISKELNAKDIYIEYLKGKGITFIPIRYLFQLLKTFAVMISENPDVIIAMNPPFIAPLCVYLYSMLFNKKFIIDSHTGVFSGKWRKFIGVSKYLSKKALITIITNNELKNEVESWGAKAVILEDSLHDLVLDKKIERFSRFSICVINSYGDDEPLDQIFLAASRVPDCDLYVTGKIARANKNLIKMKPPNVILTDFIPDKEFVELLNKVDAAMVLTTRDLTLLEGGFESVAAEKPLITSNWPVLKNYFSKGTIYVDNTSESLEKAIEEMKARKMELKEEIVELKNQLKVDWNEKFQYFFSCICEAYKL